jgi:hypothetical protein
LSLSSPQSSTSKKKSRFNFVDVYVQFYSDNSVAKIVGSTPIPLAPVLMRLREWRRQISELARSRFPKPLRRSPNPNRTVVGCGDEDSRINRIPGDAVHRPAVSGQDRDGRFLLDVVDVNLVVLGSRGHKILTGASETTEKSRLRIALWFLNQLYYMQWLYNISIDINLYNTLLKSENVFRLWFFI